jgi:hypothetical protein
MRKEFLDYFDVIGITEPIRQRIETFLENFKEICPGEEFVDIAVNDYVNEDGTKSYTAIRFYSSKRVVMVRNISEGSDFSVSGLSQNVDYIEIKVSAYDFKKATERSRIRIVVRFPFLEKKFVALNGSGTNCDHLMEIYRKYYLPRVML